MKSNICRGPTYFATFAEIPDRWAYALYNTYQNQPSDSPVLGYVDLSIIERAAPRSFKAVERQL